MQRNLSFEQAPPLSAPFRFFLTAPVFALVAGLLMLWQGPDALASRWSPATLALTHLLTLGFAAMSMIGALMQILPVVTDVYLPGPGLTAGVVHASLTVGAAILVTGFMTSNAVLFRYALPLLALAFSWLLAASAYGFWRSSGTTSATLATIRLALGGLLVTIILGITLGSAFAWRVSLPLIQLTNLHASWGLLGWMGLLVIGVAFQVVPMFQVTPLYPQLVMRWLARALFMVLLLWSVIQVTPWATSAECAKVIGALIAAALVVFALATFYLLWRKKRNSADTTTLFWRTSMASLLGCVTLWSANTWLPRGIDSASYPLALGVLFIVGFAYSAINGMLYKIVPFLVWYHLQSQASGGCGKVPNTKKILPDQATEKQFWAHLAALILMVGATIWPNVLSRLAAIVFAASSCWLWVNLLTAARIYRNRIREEQRFRQTSSKNQARS